MLVHIYVRLAGDFLSCGLPQILQIKVVKAKRFSYEHPTAGTSRNMFTFLFHKKFLPHYARVATHWVIHSKATDAIKTEKRWFLPTEL